VPSVIAWSTGGEASFDPPDGFTEVCTVANACTPVESPLTVGVTPVRLTP